MKASDLIKIYKEDAIVSSLAEYIKPNEGSKVHLKGCTGSLDAVIAAAVYSKQHQNHLFILHEKEEAAYFANDLQNLLPGKNVFLFPSSYKRPYQFEEIENANVLMRAEILNQINHKSSTGELIVTYPEALTEKVINKSSLLKNTFSASKGESLDINFLTELLTEYDFEKADFVYEPGQFAVRGGILDIYSFASDLPYRIELFGDEIESIRSFDPSNQLSINELKSINIIPNIQTKLLEERRQSFLQFIPKNTKIWFKDEQHTLDVIDKYYERAEGSFDEILRASGNTQVVLDPSALFETASTFSDNIGSFAQVHFGNRFYGTADHTIEYPCSPQPYFHKNFELIVKDLNENQGKGLDLVISADSVKQLSRLQTIFEELDPLLRFSELNADLRGGFIDQNVGLLCYTDHQLFDRFHRYQTKSKQSKSKALTLKELRNLQTGDFVVHVDYGVGRFAGLDTVENNGRLQEVMRLVYRDDDLLYVSVHSLHKISKYTGKEGSPPVVNKLGTQDWDNKKKKVKKKVKDIAKELIGLYAKRKAARGLAFDPDGFLQAELESSFIYQDTPDQASATQDVKNDMEQPHPMDRLVCGDVGFGKTEVAIRAAFKAVAQGKQVAVLVPTTILAMQHQRTFKERLAQFPVEIEYINRFRSTKAMKETLKRLKAGEVNILIGTHRIVNKDVHFKDLGLLVIDEEQKFGVKVKEKLREYKVNVDTLTLTATPIPRTLHFSLMGARDLSVIATPPPNRQPVTTELHTFNEEILRDAISYELRRGGQVFFVHNRVQNIDEIANIVHKLVPDARIGIAHGQMEGDKLEKVMLKFIEGEYDVLVSTNIIESGLDIPNANTIIINRAHMFGLSDLHQMRGRVGRSNKKAFCYLLSQPTASLTSDARKRLSTLEEFTDLGDGFKVAMRDLDIRGAGNLLGGEQSGFINDLGFDMYHKVLDEAIQELKETEFKELFENDFKEKVKALVTDCSIETDLEILIPDNYVSNISERLSLYTQLDNIKNEEELAAFEKSITDRFGPVPESVVDLIKSVRLRWLGIQLGFERISLKKDALKCYFPPSEREDYFKSDTFGHILTYVQLHAKKCRMKDIKNRLILIISDIEEIDSAIKELQMITKESEVAIQ
ncbi:MAG: transcription-repair coupling factor [Cyclobacteriaceae bacterium]